MNKIVKELNLLLADLQVFRANVQGCHWSLRGCHSFLSVHAYMDVIYEDASKDIDAIAEFIRIYRAEPIITLSKYVRRASIQEIELEQASKVEHVLDKVFVDLTKLNLHFFPIFDLTTTELDIGDHMAVMTATYGKHLWFIRSLIKKEDEQEEEKEDSEESESSED